jgi:hypothetical protein
VSDDAHFASPLGTRQRLIAGILGIGVGFGGPFLLSVALVATSGDPSFSSCRCRSSAGSG